MIAGPPPGTIGIDLPLDRLDGRQAGRGAAVPLGWGLCITLGQAWALRG